MNQVNLTGNLTKDPELKTLSTSTAVTSFTIAVNSGWGDNKKTSFIPVKVWNKTAENCHKFLNKGSKVAVSGRIDTGNYEKEGKTIYTWEVVANNVEFLSTKNSSNDNNLDDTPPPFSDESIPF